MKINNLLLLFIPFILLGCFASLPPKPNKNTIITSEGFILEERIQRSLSRRPTKVFYVYRDSIGNYIQHGSQLEYYKNGQLKSESEYRHGKLHGSSHFWYPNGHKQGVFRYQYGKLEGVCETWYKTGRIQSRKNWRSGKLHGKSTQWDSKGNITQETHWIHNKRLIQ